MTEKDPRFYSDGEFYSDEETEPEDFGWDDEKIENEKRKENHRIALEKIMEGKLTDYEEGILDEFSETIYKF